jgi:hypothetical protein
MNIKASFSLSQVADFALPALRDSDFPEAIRMRFARYFCILVMAILSSATAGAADLSTPESAVAAFFDAYARGDIDGIVAARDFEFEARQTLSGAAGSPAPDEAAVQRIARAKEAALRTRLQVQGVSPTDDGPCKPITTWRLRDDVAKVFFECPGPTGDGLSGVMFRATLVAKSAVGWRVVLDLDGSFPLHSAH